MSGFVLADMKGGIPNYFTLDRKLSGGTARACFQADKDKAVHFARTIDAEQFKDAYYPFLDLTALPV